MRQVTQWRTIVHCRGLCNRRSVNNALRFFRSASCASRVLGSMSTRTTMRACSCGVEMGSTVSEGSWLPALLPTPLSLGTPPSIGFAYGKHRVAGASRMKTRCPRSHTTQGTRGPPGLARRVQLVELGSHMLHAYHDTHHPPATKERGPKPIQESLAGLHGR